MPQRRPHTLSLKANKPGRYGKPDMRSYESFRNPGERPSLEFNWEPALLAFALTMRSLGYELSRTQQKRIDDHAR